MEYVFVHEYICKVYLIAHYAESMKLTKQSAIEAVLTEITRRSVQRRIELGLTQQEVSDQTGISLRTIKQFESGGDCRFSTLIRLLQAYDLTDRLDILVPEPSISSIRYIDQQQKTRKRVSKTARLAKLKPAKQWT